MAITQNDHIFYGYFRIIPELLWVFVYPSVSRTLVTAGSIWEIGAFGRERARGELLPTVPLSLEIPPTSFEEPGQFGKPPAEAEGIGERRLDGSFAGVDVHGR